MRQIMASAVAVSIALSAVCGPNVNGHIASQALISSRFGLRILTPCAHRRAQAHVQRLQRRRLRSRSPPASGPTTWQKRLRSWSASDSKSGAQEQIVASALPMRTNDHDPVLVRSRSRTRGRKRARGRRRTYGIRRRRKEQLPALQKRSPSAPEPERSRSRSRPPNHDQSAAVTPARTAERQRDSSREPDATPRQAAATSTSRPVESPLRRRLLPSDHHSAFHAFRGEQIQLWRAVREAIF
jgi:hypothetical protein